MTLCRYFPTLCRLTDTRRAGVCCRTEEATTTSTTAAPVLAPRCGEVSFSVETEDRDNVQFPGAKAYNIGCRLRFHKYIVTKHPPRKFETTQLSLRISNVRTAVSLSLLHSHTCFIYEANMRHIWDKYAAFMMQISIIFSKNEVLSTTIFEYCQNIIKLLFLMFQCTVVQP